MASIKVKFYSYAGVENEGTIGYKIVCKNLACSIKTDYRLFVHEWNNKESSVVITDNKRRNYLQSINECVRWDVKRLNDIACLLENRQPEFTATDAVSLFKSQDNKETFFCFMCTVIVQIERMGRWRTAEAYRSALRSFSRFRDGKDLLLKELDHSLMQMYEGYMLGRGLTKNSTSFYMRILRAVYNRAVENGLTADRNPFKHVYTGVDKTIKRAIPLKAIKQIKRLDLSSTPSLDFARDMFLFSFYTRGMSFVDMAYLKKKDLANGILSYRRRKTGQLLHIRWEGCMQDILDKYGHNENGYLLPIITRTDRNARLQYLNTSRLVNGYLKIISARINISPTISMYSARHSWASIAKSKNIPISVISESMGHDSEKTTQIYLKSLDVTVVDKANSLILNCL